MNIFKQRMLNVARACREARADLFDMGLVIHGCGSPGCAWGNYAARGDLQSEFRLRHVDYRTPSTLHLPSGQWITIRDKPVQVHLGITLDEVIELFNSDGCGDAHTPAEAAQYVEAFAERKWPEPEKRTDAELVSALMARVTSGERIPEDA